MSRIFGIVSDFNQRAAWAQQIATHLSSAPYSVSQIITADNMSFVFSGTKPARHLYHNDGLLIVFDGFIYDPQTEQPCQTLAQLYRSKGFAEMLAHINGDFAIALYDSEQSSLWLGRDRFGLKPLYYTNGDWGFAFASQPKRLLALPPVNRAINKRYVGVYAASHYRYFDNQMAESPFEEISQLPPAHFLHFESQSVRTIERYWQLEEAPDWSYSPEDLAARYQSLLQQAVSRRLRAFEKPAFTLSGGMDSSSVLAMAVKDSGQKQHAFSTVYQDKTYDESEDIKTILFETVHEWHPISVDEPDILTTVSKMVQAHDEPVATATWLSHFLLSEQVAAQGFDVLVGGLGGDELNAGEYEYFPYFFADLQQQGQPQRLDREIHFWAKYHSHPLYPKNETVVQQAFANFIDFTQPGHIQPDYHRMRRYADVLNPDFFDLNSFEPTLEHPFTSYLKNRTYQDLSRETIPCCLRAEDRQTHAWGITNALPFLDHHLVEFMYRVPSEYKYQDGVTKHLLRQATQGILPDETRTRIKKTGWNAPGHLWFSGAGRDMVMDLIHTHSFRQRGIYDLRRLEQLIHEHDQIIREEQVRENHMMLLWQVVNLALWFDHVERLPVLS